jgi:glycosyltransferase involved in cell wall biosynthesis
MDSQNVFIFIPGVHVRSGVYRYCLELLSALLAMDVSSRLCIVYFKGNIVAEELHRRGTGENAQFFEISFYSEVRAIARENDIAVAHFLSPDLRSLMVFSILSSRIKKLMTIHDFYCFTIRFSFSSPKYWLKEKTRAILLRVQSRNVAKFVAISRNTQNGIEKFLGIPAERITVVYSGTPEMFFASAKLPAKNEFGNYLLMHFAQVDFLPLFKKILALEPDFMLICFWTNNSFREPALQRARELGIENKIVFKVNISDEELIGLYKNARCFIRYVDDEGFGLPVVEAMACGCPVLVTDRGSLPEVVGNSEFVIPRENMEEWVEKLKKMHEDKNFRAAAVLKGKERAAEFRWNTAAAKIGTLYELLRGVLR